MITIPSAIASLLRFRLGLIKSGPLTDREIEKLNAFLLSDGGLENAMDVSPLTASSARCSRGRMSSCPRNGCGGSGMFTGDENGQSESCLNVGRVPFEAPRRHRKWLSRRANELQRQLSRLSGEIGSGKRCQRSSLKGRKAAIKYRDKAGNKWAGRGAQPIWLREKLKAGAKLEDFAVHKTVASRRRIRKRRKTKR